MTKLDQTQIASLAAKSLDKSVTELDVAIKARLDESRQRALLIKQVSEPMDEGLERIVEASKVSLDDSSHILTSEVSQRLDAIREQALTQPVKIGTPDAKSFTEYVRRFFTNLRLAVPVSGFATAFVLVVVVSLVYQNSGPTGSLFIDDDIVLFASADDIELYENLEFYQWLADNGFPD